MREFSSFLAPEMRAFVSFRIACGCWNDTYEDYLFYFDRHCTQAFPEEGTLTKEMVDSFCAKRPSETGNTCRVRAYAVANFIEYLRRRGLARLQPPDIPKQTHSGYIPHAFTDLELERFFSASNDMPVSKPNSLAGRTRKVVVPVFFRLLYSSGIRTYEARMLKTEDVDIPHGVLNIRTAKGSNQYYVALHNSMGQLLARYDQAIRGLYPKRVYFFPSARGSFLSKEWVNYNFRQIWNSANTAHATAYELRHNYAVANINRWVKDGFDFLEKLVYLSKSMGHVTLESTKYYFHLVPTMSNILLELTGDGFDEIVPEVPREES
jgi:site-specific recombinase XerD